MTTSVIITSTSPNHKRVRIATMAHLRNGEKRETYSTTLEEGESTPTLYLHDYQSLVVEEVD